MTTPNAVENRRYVVRDSYGARSIETPLSREGVGVVVTYRRGRSKRIYIRGYYNDLGMVGLDLTLREFCQALGLTARDVEQALRDPTEGVDHA